MDQFFNQGWEAFDDGLTVNPYQYGTWEYDEWNLGYLACEATRAGGNYAD